MFKNVPHAQNKTKNLEPREMRTKLYLNPFFSTGHQNVNKLENRTANIVFGPIFLPFYVIIVGFFSFFHENANITGSNCAIIGCNFSKKHKLVLYQTKTGEPNFGTDIKIL